MKKLTRILCWFNRHDYQKRVRSCAPALGKEEMRCTRCGDHFLVIQKQPKFHKTFAHKSP